MEFKGTKGKLYQEFSELSQLSPNGQVTIKAGDVGIPVAVLPMPIGATKDKQLANATLFTESKNLLEVCIKAYNLCDRLQMPTETELNKMKSLLHKAISKAVQSK